MSLHAWSGSDPAESTDSASYELGTTWLSGAQAIVITGIHVWAGANGAGIIPSRLGRVWSSAGALLGTANLPNTLPAGWSTWDLTAPVTIPPATKFVTSYTNGGYYGQLNHALDSAVVSSDGAVTAVAAGSNTAGNGSFTTSLDALPDHASPQNTFYGIDFAYSVQTSEIATIAKVTTSVDKATVTATISASDNNGLIGAVYGVSWGDGQVTSGSSATESHTYISSGVYPVLVTVTTAAGTAYAAAAVTVLVPAPTGVGDAANALVMALSAVTDLRVYTDPGANIEPPGAVLGLPELEWETYNTSEPTQATFLVYLMVQADQYATSRLWGFVDDVSAALWGATDFAVTRAVPGTYQTSNTDLPAYVLTVAGPAS